MVFVDSREVHQARTRSIIDVTWYCEGECKLAIAHTIRTIVKCLQSVVIGEGYVGRLVLLLARYEFFGISYDRRDESIEVRLLITILCDRAFHLHD